MDYVPAETLDTREDERVLAALWTFEITKVSLAILVELRRSEIVSKKFFSNSSWNNFSTYESKMEKQFSERCRSPIDLLDYSKRQWLVQYMAFTGDKYL